MPQVEHLASLGDGAKQWIVRALALFLAIDAHRRAFGKPTGRQHRTIKIHDPLPTMIEIATRELHGATEERKTDTKCDGMEEARFGAYYRHFTIVALSSNIATLT